MMKNAGTGFRRNMRHNEDGVASVEFALIAPVMILLLAGLVDAGMAMLKYRHAFQAAASLAETGSRLSIAEKRGEKSPANPITQEQVALLNNGIKLVMGDDADDLKASALRVIRSGGKVKSEWAWTHKAGKGVASVDKDGGGRAAFDVKEVLALTRDGESLLVADVSFEHKLLFGLLGTTLELEAHYTAGVPSY